MHGARRLKKSEQLGLDARYQLLLRLAAGGMGAVYVGVARSSADPALYAIKRAHSHLLEQPEFRKMFVAEATLARRIHHPNAIGVLDVDESDGELMMIMRYVEGGSLSDLLVASHERGRRITPSVTLRIVADAARGLEAAHALQDPGGKPLGIVHRDVSPHNILVGLDGVASIVDFGVAKAAFIEMTRTATDIMKGKTAYMAPEYVKSRIANAQTDVFALGIVAWESLANRRLFKGEDELDTIKRVLDPAPAPLLHQIVDLDPTVAAVVARAVAKDPTKRFPSALSFCEALERAARDADLLASPAEVAATAKTLLAPQLAERRELLAEALAERARAAPAPVVVPAPAVVPAPSVAPAPLQRSVTESMPLDPSALAVTHVAGPTPRPPDVRPSAPSAAAWIAASTPPPPAAPAVATPDDAGRKASLATTMVMPSGADPPPALHGLAAVAPPASHIASFEEPAATQAIAPGIRDAARTATPTTRMARPSSRRGVVVVVAAVVTAGMAAALAFGGREATGPDEVAAPDPSPARVVSEPPAALRLAEPASEPPAAPSAEAPPPEAPPPSASTVAPLATSSADASPASTPATSGARPRPGPPAPARPSAGGGWRPKANPY